MPVGEHFAFKKQRFLNFFASFHSLLDEVSFSCLMEIERESKIAEKMLKGCTETILEIEFAKMARREPEAFLKIIDNIAKSLKK